MLKDVTLGQYFPGNSLLHRLDPRIKIIACIGLIVAVFLCKNIASFGFLTAMTLLLIVISRIPLKTILKGLKPVLVIILFTAVLNLFFTKPENAQPLFRWSFIEIYKEGIFYAFFMALRIVLLILLTETTLTYTTSPIDLTDGIERLLSPLKVFHLPVHEFAMMMTIALRFIPTLIEETDRIMQAQKARGADYSSGNIFSRIKALVPVLVPLFVSAFRRALELADAMECRCYHGGEGRTRMKILKLRGYDYLYLVAVALLIAAIVLLGIFAGYGYQIG